jgi:hypothetical protein
MERPKIAEFQSRLKGLVLGHGTHQDREDSIRVFGLTQQYNYACVEEGWSNGLQDTNIQFLADSVADRTYPDPEGQWGEQGTAVYTLEKLVESVGLEGALDLLEKCFSGQGFLEDFGGDVLDPNNYNLVVIGPVPPSAIIR